MSDEPRPVRFLVGSGDIREFLANQQAEEAEQQQSSNAPEPEDLEFVSPSVPGRRVRMLRDEDES